MIVGLTPSAGPETAWKAEVAHDLAETTSWRRDCRYSAYYLHLVTA